MKLTILLLLCIAFTTIMKAQNTITITPADAMVELSLGQPAMASTNYSSYTLFAASDWTWNGELWVKSFLKIDLSSLPCGATINQVKLYLYSNGSHSNTTIKGSGYKSNACWLVRTSADWSVNTITWNNQPATTTINQVALSNSTSASQDYVADITQLVNDMRINPNQGNGLALVLQNYPVGKYSQMAFYSSDYTDVAKKPKIEITYTANPLIANAGDSYTICNGTSTTIGGNPTASGGGTGGYTYSWSPSTGLNASGVANPIATPATTTTYTVTVTDVSGCGVATSSTVVTVLQLPGIGGTISGSTSVCQGQTSVAYSVPAITDATGYNWTLPTGASIATGANSRSITVNYSTTAISGNIKVSGTNTCGTGVTSPNLTITVNSLPSAGGSISGPTSVCYGSTNVPFSTTTISNTSGGYQWELPSGSGVMGPNPSPTNSILAGISGTSGNIRVRGVNSCGYGAWSANKYLTVMQNVGTIGTISGPTPICQGSSDVTYSVPAVTGAVAYTWTLPTGATVVPGTQPNSNSIRLNFSYTATNSNIKVTATDCHGSTVTSANRLITFLAAPDETGVQGDPSFFCKNPGEERILMVDMPENGYVEWNLPSEVYFTSGSENSYNFSYTSNFSSGTVHATIFNAEGCQREAEPQELVAYPYPASAGVISTSNASVCQGQTAITYTVPPISNANKYVWTLPFYLGSNITDVNSITVNYPSNAVTGNASVHGQWSFYNGVYTPNDVCDGPQSQTLPVTVNPLPVAYSINGGGNYCEGSSGVPIGLMSSQVGVNYQLYFGSNPVGSLVTGTGSDISFGNQTGIGTYTILATNNLTSCSRLMNGNTTVSTNPLPASFSVTGNGVYYTVGLGIPIGLNGSEIGINYQLLNNLIPVGNVIGGTGSDISFGNQTGSGTYTVQAINSSINCTNIMGGAVTIPVIPDAPLNFTAVALSDNVINLTWNDVANETGYRLEQLIDLEWQLVSTLDADANNFIHSELTPNTTYIYRLVAFNDLMDYQPTPQIVVNTMPDLSSNPDFMKGAIELTNVIDWQSDFGIFSTENGTSDGVKPSEWPNGPNYNKWFKFRAINSEILVRVISGGEMGSLKNPFVAIWDSLGNEIISAVHPEGDETMAQLYINNLITGNLYYVSVDNDIEASNKGTFSLLVTSIFGSVSSNISVCSGESIEVVATGGINYLWTPSTGLSSDIVANPIVNIPSSQTYHVLITNKYNYSVNREVNITVQPNPVANAGGDITICSGENVQLNATGGEYYIWSPAKYLNSASIKDPIANPLSTTEYMVTVIDENHCKATDNIVVNVQEGIKANAGEDIILCQGESATLMATGGSQFKWTPSEGLSNDEIPNPIVNPVSTTTYYVNVSDVSGCTARDTVTVYLNPDPSAEAGYDKVICNGDMVMLNATGGVTYSWEPASGIVGNSNIPNPFVKPENTTQYIVTVSNRCGNSSTDFVNIIVSICTNYIMLTQNIDATIYHTRDNKIGFIYDEKYNMSGTLNYKIFNTKNEIVSAGHYLENAHFKEGLNKFDLHLGVPDGQYVLQITDSKGSNMYVKFEHISVSEL